ncbi:MAG: DUF5647 family protein [Candidatus Bipolaricaulota bacterium]|nr:DUF5647 family protein [Candidatus Bipolaricaulota bacterium]
MNEKIEEFFARNSELSTEFSRYVLEHPNLDDQIPEDGVLIFLPEYDQELKEFNLKMAQELRKEGGEVIYVKVKEMAPKVTSRLVGVDVGAP